jgi:hypothetical protein
MAADFVSMTCAVFYIRGHYRAESAESWAVQLEGIQIPGAAETTVCTLFSSIRRQDPLLSSPEVQNTSASAEMGGFYSGCVVTSDVKARYLCG